MFPIPISADCRPHLLGQTIHTADSSNGQTRIVLTGSGASIDRAGAPLRNFPPEVERGARNQPRRARALFLVKNGADATPAGAARPKMTHRLPYSAIWTLLSKKFQQATARLWLERIDHLVGRPPASGGARTWERCAPAVSEKYSDVSSWQGVPMVSMGRIPYLARRFFFNIPRSITPPETRSAHNNTPRSIL